MAEDRGRKSLGLGFMIVDCIVTAGHEMRGVTDTGCLYSYPFKKEYVINNPLLSMFNFLMSMAFFFCAMLIHQQSYKHMTFIKVSVLVATIKHGSRCLSKTKKKQKEKKIYLNSV